jgi:predicted DNA binding CopG/RHH family protein
MKKPIPTFETDQEAERFVESADLSVYDLSGARPVQFEFDKKDARVNMRLPQGLVDALKDKAQQRGIPYQRLIREALERIVSSR